MTLGGPWVMWVASVLANFSNWVHGTTPLFRPLSYLESFLQRTPPYHKFCKGACFSLKAGRCPPLLGMQWVSWLLGCSVRKPSCFKADMSSVLPDSPFPLTFICVISEFHSQLAMNLGEKKRGGAIINLLKPQPSFIRQLWHSQVFQSGDLICFCLGLWDWQPVLQKWGEGRLVSIDTGQN